MFSNCSFPSSVYFSSALKSFIPALFIIALNSLTFSAYSGINSLQKPIVPKNPIISFTILVFLYSLIVSVFLSAKPFFPLLIFLHRYTTFFSATTSLSFDTFMPILCNSFNTSSVFLKHPS